MTTTVHPAMMYTGDVGNGRDLPQQALSPKQSVQRSINKRSLRTSASASTTCATTSSASAPSSPLFSFGRRISESLVESTRSSLCEVSKRSRRSSSQPQRKQVRFEEKPSYQIIPTVDKSRNAELWVQQNELYKRRRADMMLAMKGVDGTTGSTSSCGKSKAAVEGYVAKCDELYYAVCDGRDSDVNSTGIDFDSLSQVLQGLEMGLRGIERWSDAGSHRRLRIDSVRKKILDAQPRRNKDSGAAGTENAATSSLSAAAAAEAFRQYSCSLTQDCRVWSQISAQADALVVRQNRTTSRTGSIFGSGCDLAHKQPQEQEAGVLPLAQQMELVRC